MRQFCFVWTRNWFGPRSSGNFNVLCILCMYVCMYVCIQIVRQGHRIASFQLYCCSELETKKTFWIILLPLSYCVLWWHIICRLTSILCVSHLKCLRRSCTDLGNIQLFCSSEEVGRIRFKSTVRRGGDQRYVVQ